MTLATFYAKVSRALRRGASSDAVIPDWAEGAAQWLEQNYSFHYMNRIEEYPVSVGTGSNILALESKPKAIAFVRSIRADYPDRFRYLEKVQAKDVTSIDSGDPSYYWFNGMREVQFDARITAARAFQVGGYFYTDWSEFVAGDTPVLLDYYENLLLAQTLIDAAIDLKDDRMVAAYNVKFERALAACLVAEEEQKRLGTEKIMRYVPR